MNSDVVYMGFILIGGIFVSMISVELIPGLIILFQNLRKRRK